MSEPAHKLNLSCPGRGGIKTACCPHVTHTGAVSDSVNRSDSHDFYYSYLLQFLLQFSESLTTTVDMRSTDVNMFLFNDFYVLLCNQLFLA